MKASEKEALMHECLVKNYEKYYRMAYSYVFCEQDAMDIVQEGAYRAILKSDCSQVFTDSDHQKYRT